MLVAAIAYPVFACGPEQGRGHHMKGDWGRGPGDCMRSGGGYKKLTDEQRTQLDNLHQKFYDETADIRSGIWSKSGELNILMNTSTPDPEKAKTLQKEIGALKAKMAEKRLEFELDARKIAPDVRLGRGHGRGHGRHMKDYGCGHGHGLD